MIFFIIELIVVVNVTYYTFTILVDTTTMLVFKNPNPDWLHIYFSQAYLLGYRCEEGIL